MQDVVTRKGTVKKPSTILEYNKSKSFIDVSDQKTAYASTIQKGIKWYRKIIFELLTNTAVVNAHLLFIQVTREKMSITQFLEELVLALTKLDDRTSQRTEANHRLKDIKQSGRCSSCYRDIAKKFGLAQAMAKKVSTNCIPCKDLNNFICSKCFFATHTVSVKK
ncbi:uncharacterized protein LOC130442516 [Diorhabda sublineata]|uniref:uncharacterized protein LOC130442516 n=1 Tax=Diorhabda sublineata TaxID=1163346 RepID=UPI0024E083BA|nr:uncharacterized protein LOC130442516 [Diorhabda sublineata]